MTAPRYPKGEEESEVRGRLQELAAPPPVETPDPAEVGTVGSPSDAPSDSPPAKRQPTAMERAETALIRARPRMAELLGSEARADRVIRLALLACRDQPALLACSLESLILAVAKSCAWGLDIGGSLGQCYLVPYGREVTCQLGYRGMVELVRRSGRVIAIAVNAVHMADEWHYEDGLAPVLRHVPELDGDPGELRLVYAIARYGDGTTDHAVMSRAQVEAIRAKSQGAKSERSPWNGDANDYEEMAKKTVIRRLCKRLPMSAEARDIISEDDYQHRAPERISGTTQERARALLAPKEE